MFDTRLIHQVVELERRIQIENEKKGNYRPVVNAPFSHCLEYFCKAAQTILARIYKLNRVNNFPTHSSEEDGTLEHSAYNTSQVQ
jgi:hypothetical protein